MATGISLHIGINEVNPAHYAGWVGTLAACEYDAADYRAIAEAQGFRPQSLLTREGTREAVREAIRAAAAELQEGDIFFLSYAGHGGALPDASGDEEDNQDETWCLYDGQLLDDELAELWEQFRAGVRVLVISDSCHSGTVTRETPAGEAPIAKSELYAQLGVRPRAMPPREAALTYRRNRSFYRGLFDRILGRREQAELGPVQARIRLLSGCQDNQLSGDGAFNGVFTSKLKQVWRNGAFQGSYAELHRRIVRRMPPHQTPNHFVYGGEQRDFDRERAFTR